MSLFFRSPQNPILSPDPLQPWGAAATFNGCVVKQQQKYFMVYRALSHEQEIDGQKVRLSTVGIAESDDGEQFANRRLLIAPAEEWDKYGCEDPRITFLDGKYYIFYTAISQVHPDANSIKCAVAITRDLITIDERHLITTFDAKAMTLFPQLIDRKYTLLLTMNTDQPPARIMMAQASEFSEFYQPNFWEKWLTHADALELPLCRVNNDQVEIGAPPIYTKDGWMLFYSYIKHYFSNDKIFRIEMVLLDLQNPLKILGRIENPCLIPEAEYETAGDVARVVFPSGALVCDGAEVGNGEGQVKLYYGAADTSCCVATAQLDDLMQQVEINAPMPIKAERFPHNPLLRIEPEHHFEARAVFNPAAILLEGKTYILYRTLSDRNVSAVGLAISHDGIYIDERLAEPIYVPRIPQEMRGSPIENCGCEDPRLTQMGDKLYLCYTAYDGLLPRLAMSMITVADFLARRWQNWTLPKIISAPGVGDKDGCLFPDKIRDQYAFFHRLEPNIVLDLVPNLDFPTGTFLGTTTIIRPSPNSWDDIKIGINAPPIKTPQGWLVLYHGISQNDHYYRLGALLLDLPCTEVIARTKYPLLEPVTMDEKFGEVNNVVFPCGSTVQGDILFIYYGGADKVVCGATISLSGLVNYLVRTSQKRYLLD